MSEEAEIQKTLLDSSNDLERLADTIVRAAEGRRPLPLELGDALKKIAALSVECEEAITDHLDDKLGKEVLAGVATALSAVRTGIDSLIVFKALEGTAFSTETVAND